jgi:hypothetical protein
MKTLIVNNEMGRKYNKLNINKQILILDILLEILRFLRCVLQNLINKDCQVSNATTKTVCFLKKKFRTSSIKRN